MENERFELQNVANTVDMAASSCKRQGKRAEKQIQHWSNMIQQKNKTHKKTRGRMARERRGAESSVVSMETLYYKTIY